MVTTEATHLARAILDGEDPKSFFKQMSQAAALDKRYGDRTLDVKPCEQWAEFDELEPWQQSAAKEMEVDLETYFILNRHYGQMNLTGSDAIEWTVYKDDTTAHDIAVQQVAADIEDEPETYVGEWCHQFIDTERLKRDLYDFARDEDYWRENYPDYDAKIEELVQRGKLEEDDPRITTPSGKRRKITPRIERFLDDLWEKMIEEVTEERLEDPIAYLKEIHGDEEGIKEAIKQGGIDAQAAAEYAVNGDGWQVTLSHYDGQSHELPSGAVYVRD